MLPKQCLSTPPAPPCTPSGHPSHFLLNSVYSLECTAEARRLIIGIKGNSLKTKFKKNKMYKRFHPISPSFLSISFIVAGIMNWNWNWKQETQVFNW